MIPGGTRSEAGGWHLLQGTLQRQGGAYDARLHLDLGEGFSGAHYVAVPTSVKGAINDLLCLPPGVRSLALDPGLAAAHEASDLRIRPVGPLERRVRMLQRVLPVLWRQPSAKRQGIGLTLRRALFDLQGAYEAAGRLRAHAAPPAYAEWIARFDTLTPDDRQRIRRDIALWPQRPFFHVLIVGGDAQALQRSQSSLEDQIHRDFEWSHAPGPTRLPQWNATLAAASPDHWIVLVRAGDVLAPHALYWFAHAALRQPPAAVIYADEDDLDAGGERCNPRFKPDWSWSHARSTRFFGEAVALRADAVGRAGGLQEEDLRSGSYGAVLRVLDALDADGDAEVRHIPSILLHRGPSATVPADDGAMQAVREHLARREAAATVEPVREGCWRVRHALPAQAPMVSVIVPTRDALALTRLCLDSVREKTRYPRYEILLVDNQSTDPAALAWMRAQAGARGVRLLRYDAPFNYAAINNMAVSQAEGDLVCLLNNDTEIMQPDWLEEMVSQVLQPRVDVVGAKLLYPNGRVQHGGDLVGVGGVANHAHAWLDAHEPGYCNRAVVAQEYSAVTAACLLTWRHRFLALGGLDAERLPVAFNDVDYCLRVREAGGRVVWTPHAVLVHHESVSRGQDLTPQQRRRARREAAWMRRRWRHVLGQDPFYNPNLSHERPDFSLNPAPVVHRPWLT